MAVAKEGNTGGVDGGIPLFIHCGCASAPKGHFMSGVRPSMQVRSNGAVEHQVDCVS